MLALIVIITHSHAVKTQSSSIFQAGQDITIKGKVDSFFKQNSYGYEGYVAVNQVNGQQIFWLSTPRIRLYSPVAMQIGDEFEFVCTVKPIIGRRNESGFDLEAYAMSQGLVARASVKSGRQFKIITRSDFRRSLYEKVQAGTAESPFRAMIMALVFGERSGINQILWQQLRDSGLTHLVAISGLHIGIVFGIGFVIGSLFSRLTSRLLWAPYLFGIVCAFSYAWLAGFSLPTQRALVMCIVNVVVLACGVHLSLFQRVFITLATVVAFDPFASLANSFWLSFIAVCLVVYLVQRTGSMAWWRRAVFSQLMLVVLMAPVGIHFFGGVSWTSTIFNLLFIPWFSFVLVPVVFIAVVLTFISFGSSLWIWHLVDWGFYPLIWALEQAVSGWIIADSSLLGLTIVGGLIWVLRALVSWYAVCLVVILSALWFSFKDQSPGNHWQLDVLDVGHGLAVLFEKEGQFLLYDTGSSWSGGSYVRSVIAPLIYRRGGGGLHSVIYSHLDNDHAGGKLDIEQQLSPVYVYASQPLRASRACIRDRQWNWQGLSFTVLWPPKMVPRAYNQHSCVIRVQDLQYGHTVLLSGDVTAVGEWLLSRGEREIRSDVMLVPHHGSKTSSTANFIQRVDPDIAIASLAKDNRWHLPHVSVVERYRTQQVRWLDTGESGQITIQYRAQNRHLSTLRQDGIAPWYRQMLRKGVE